jgi:hypothetical protein
VTIPDQGAGTKIDRGIDSSEYQFVTNTDNLFGKFRRNIEDWGIRGGKQSNRLSSEEGLQEKAS